jgi:hypothetical protein
MNYEEIQQKTQLIINNLNSLDGNVGKIKTKIRKINSVYKKLAANKILVNDAQNTYLVFQTNILKNEYAYYKKLYDLVIAKYASEIFELSEYIVMVLLSLNKIEVDNLEKKRNIFNKIINVKKVPNISYGKLSEIINAIINNIKLIDEFIKLFDNYVKKTLSVNKKNNIHNNNFELTITNKQNTILLEYNKYCNRGIKTINYFKDCTESIMAQINTSKLLEFFLRDNPS